MPGVLRLNRFIFRETPCIYSQAPILRYPVPKCLIYWSVSVANTTALQIELVDRRYGGGVDLPFSISCTLIRPNYAHWEPSQILISKGHGSGLRLRVWLDRRLSFDRVYGVKGHQIQSVSELRGVCFILCPCCFNRSEYRDSNSVRFLFILPDTRIASRSADLSAFCALNLSNNFDLAVD